MVCAYCEQDRLLTREHIWPASIVRNVNDRARYNAKAPKLFLADMIIKDVCAVCNNGPLSTLDAYGAELYDRFFANYVIHEAALPFSYDYPTLAKWLLKLSYNSARMVGSDVNRLGLYRSMLIDPLAHLPDDFDIFVDLVLPSTTTSQTELLPSSNRIAAVKLPGVASDSYTIRLVAINSFYFYIVIENKPEMDVSQGLAVLAKIPGTYLDPSGTCVELVSSGQTTRTAHKDLARTFQIKKLNWPKR